MKAVVLGGSGNVGQKVVSTLLASADPVYSDIMIVSRRPLPEYDDASASNGKVTVRVVENLDHVGEEIFSGFDAGFMLLGVGKASQASKDELFRVDCTIPVAFASACKKSGVQQFSTLSSVGADITQQYSSLTKSGAGGGWYLHCKGAMEDGVISQGFKSVAIFRPAGIYPGNTNTPETFGWLNEKLNWMLPSKYVTASTTVIANAMAATMKEQLSGGLTGIKILDGGQEIRDVTNKSAV